MPLSVAIITPEVAPFSKAGGLADVVNALPKHLRLLGCDATIVTPYYGFMDHQNIATEPIGEATIRLGKKSFPIRYVRATLPGHTPVPVYMVQQADLYGNREKPYHFPDDAVRWAVFDLAVFELFRLLGTAPDVLHCHDWPAGLVPNILRTTYLRDPFWKKTVSVFTIHNLLYQMQGMWYDVPVDERDDGRGAPRWEDKLFHRTNFVLRAIRYSDLISTVSERYAQEILTKKFGEGLDTILRRRKDRVFGIIHGIDYTIFNPSFDSHLTIHYDWNSLDKKLENKRHFQREYGLDQSSSIPMIGMAHRFSEQKGFNLLMDILPILMQQPVQLAVVGSGEQGYVRFFQKAMKKYPRQVAAHLEFSEAQASRIYAASDIFLMPSRFEPCGISQLISLRYGSIPVVHHTGGLADTITDFDPRTGVGNGFVFPLHDSRSLLVAITRAMETYKYPQVWERLTWQAMRQSFSWELPAEKYIELFERARQLHALV